VLHAGGLGKNSAWGNTTHAELMFLSKPGKPRQLYFDRKVMLKIARAIRYQPRPLFLE
jgi:hypothetical protein